MAKPQEKNGAASLGVSYRDFFHPQAALIAYERKKNETIAEQV